MSLKGSFEGLDDDIIVSSIDSDIMASNVGRLLVQGSYGCEPCERKRSLGI
jgi:hypothetical protein